MDEAQAIKDAIAHVKEKSEHRGIPDSFVQAALEKTRKQLPPDWQKKLAERIANAKNNSMLRKSPAYEQWFKSARAWLRRAHGMWYADEQETAQMRKQHMNEFSDVKDKWVGKKRWAGERMLGRVMTTHPSTRERTSTDYKRIITFCFEKFVIPKERCTIIDLGCGVNIASAAYWPKVSAYVGYDIMPPPDSFTRAVAQKYKFKALTHTIDLGSTNPDEIQERIIEDVDSLGIILPFDLCFLWKTADVLEAQKRGVTQRLLRAVPARRLVVSFATRSLGGKKRIDPRTRAWFTHFLEHEGWTFETLETPTEFFYRIDRA